MRCLYEELLGYQKGTGDGTQTTKELNIKHDIIDIVRIEPLTYFGHAVRVDGKLPNILRYAQISYKRPREHQKEMMAGKY